MLILLDECVPARLRKAFPGHAVLTVTQTGWRTSKDGALLAFVQDRFDVFVTVDRQLEKQNDLSHLRLGFLVARVPNNRLDGFEPIFSQLNAAAKRVRHGATPPLRRYPYSTASPALLWNQRTLMGNRILSGEKEEMRHWFFSSCIWMVTLTRRRSLTVGSVRATSCINQSVSSLR